MQLRSGIGDPLAAVPRQQVGINRLRHVSLLLGALGMTPGDQRFHQVGRIVYAPVIEHGLWAGHPVAVHRRASTDLTVEPTPARMRADDDLRCQRGTTPLWVERTHLN